MGLGDTPRLKQLLGRLTVRWEKRMRVERDRTGWDRRVGTAMRRPADCKMANLPTYLPTYLPSYLPSYLPTFLPTYLPTDLLRDSSCEF